jgi:hypothetical protein
MINPQSFPVSDQYQRLHTDDSTDRRRLEKGPNVRTGRTNDNYLVERRESRAKSFDSLDGSEGSFEGGPEG